MRQIIFAAALAAASALAAPAQAQGQAPVSPLNELPQFELAPGEVVEPVGAYLALSPDGDPAIASIPGRSGAITLAVPRDGDYWLVVTGGRPQAEPARVRLVFGEGERSVSLPPCADACTPDAPLALRLQAGDEVEVRVPVIVITGTRIQRQRYNGLIRPLS